MVNTCCVCGKQSNPNENRTFHCFPKNADLKQKWFTAIGKVVNYSARVCSDHFSQDDFNHDTTERKRLLSTAIPCEKNRTIPTHKDINEQNEYCKDENHLDIVDEQRSHNTNANISNNNSQTSVESNIDSNPNPDKSILGKKTYISEHTYSCMAKRLIDVCDESYKKIYLDLPNNEVAALTKSDFTSNKAWNTFVRSTIYTRHKRKILIQKCNRLKKKSLQKKKSFKKLRVSKK